MIFFILYVGFHIVSFFNSESQSSLIWRNKSIFEYFSHNHFINFILLYLIIAKNKIAHSVFKRNING